MAFIRFEQLDPGSNMLTLQEELDRFLRNPSFNLGLRAKGPIPRSTSSTVAMELW
jgi:hypothetical protein